MIQKNITEISIEIFPASINVCRKNLKTGLKILTSVHTDELSLTDITLENQDKISKIIKLAVEEAENKSKILIRKAVVDVYDLMKVHIESRVIQLKPDKEIEQSDIDVILWQIKDKYYNYYETPTAITVSPYEYCVDEEGGIGDPIGMCGSKLEAHCLIGMIQSLKIDKIRNLFKMIGIEITRFQM